MISVRATLKNGKVKLLEPLGLDGEHAAILTVLDQPTKPSARRSFAALNRLVGVVRSRRNGSTQHDRYIYDRDNS